MSIAAEVLAGLQEAGTATGGAPLVVTFSRRGAAQINPWDAAATPTTFALTVVDLGFKQKYGPQPGAVRTARMLIAAATGTPPLVGDKVTLAGLTHDVLAVMPQAPAGVALYYDLEISA